MVCNSSLPTSTSSSSHKRTRATHALFLCCVACCGVLRSSDAAATASQPQEVVMDAHGKIRNMVEETTAAAASSSSQHDKYGVGASWPMTQHKETAFSESRTQAYETFMEGCFGSSDHHRQYEEACQQWESDRLSMNTRQPMLSQNYTHAGYAKVSTPPLVQDLLQHVWKEHREDDTTTESWERPNTYLNHWESPTQMLDISRYLSPTQQGQLIAAVQSVLEAWTQESLVLTSLYGIRIYQRGAILAPHVDRLPLVTSAILQVDQSVDTDWPLEVIGRDGMAVNLTSLPGEMILYESHSTIHGRPFALQGDYYANVFLHFEPVGHSMRHAQQFSTPSSSSEQAAASYERALAYQQEQQQRNKKKEEEDHDSSPGSSPTLPHYISPDKEARWRQQFEFEKEPEVYPKPTKVLLGSMINPHHAAADGNLNALQQLAAIDRAKLFSKDHNGWTPLHEAARGGHVHVIQYLIEEGASINERTNNGRGASALWWAEHKERTEAIAFLKKHGAVSMESEIHKKQKAVAAESTSPKVDDVDDDDTTKKEVPET